MNLNIFVVYTIIQTFVEIVNQKINRLAIVLWHFHGGNILDPTGKWTCSNALAIRSDYGEERFERLWCQKLNTLGLGLHKTFKYIFFLFYLPN